MAATPARVLKIAVKAKDITDCIPLFNLLERARSENREMIALAMGVEGTATRILGPARGAFLTYGALDAKNTSAPGQLSASELRELYRADRLNQRTEIMGLVGSPVSHSLSPHIHNEAFKALDLNAVFLPFQVRDAGTFLRRMIHPATREIDWNLRGLSITAPHKIRVMEHLDWIEPSARAIGSVNTIVVEGDALHGYNTDAVGLLSPLNAEDVVLRDARCAVIGAGGAALSAIWSLQREGARVTLFARNVEKALPVADKFGVVCRELEGASFDGFDLVINATPLGTRGAMEGETPALSNQLRGARLAYDLVYNPQETRFLREAREAGCDCLGGLGMLVTQAAEQFRLWTGHAAPLDAMNRAALRMLDG
jgi:shikimate dehydrogenase